MPLLLLLLPFLLVALLRSSLAAISSLLSHVLRDLSASLKGKASRLIASASLLVRVAWVRAVDGTRWRSLNLLLQHVIVGGQVLGDDDYSLAHS